MRLVDLFVVASMPVLKVLLLTALGSFLAMDNVDVLGENARKQLNAVVFFVFNPAVVGSNLSKTVNFQSFVSVWFMPLNILSTFIVGSALGWVLMHITGVPQHLRGLVLGCCAAGNMGHLPLIIIPAICKEEGSPFGDPGICNSYGMAYASLSMAIGAIFLWSYVYNIVRVYSGKVIEEAHIEDDSKSNEKISEYTPKSPEWSYSEPLLLSKDCSISLECTPELTSSDTKSEGVVKVRPLDKIWQFLRLISSKLNLKALFAPSIVGAIIGFTIGIVPKFRNLIVGSNAPLRVVQDSASLLGDAAIPIVTLIVGGNLLRGLRGSGIRPSLVLGVLAVRYVLLPLLGIVIVKGAIRFGLVNSDPLYQFILLLQYTLPPAMNIGTITQLFRAGESECSVIMLWTYALASISITLWSTFFMWLVS
ncbi:hypothetical protein SLA2020_135740 [Shorea laevis]